MNFARHSFAIEEHGTHTSIYGDINRDNIISFVQQLTAHPLPVGRVTVFDMTNLEIEDGLALVTTVNMLRAIGQRIARLIIRGAPTSLTDSLYKQGLLDGTHGILLEEPTIDELMPQHE